MKVGYSYLQRQFLEVDGYLDAIRDIALQGDFTLGDAVAEFERRFADLCGLKYAVGVASGTDALVLSLKSLGIGHGDEVITTPNTFISTVGAIVMTGARPVFVDNNEAYTIDVDQIEQAITPATKAIIPVHLTGCPADMPTIMKIAQQHELFVIEDAAQAILASIDGSPVGSFGTSAAFSLHPLKNLNVWGDGGIITTESKDFYEKLKLFRNHGLKNRDEVELFGHNSRLDTIQAAIGNQLMSSVTQITDTRIANAKLLDKALNDLHPNIIIPPRANGFKQVFHTYVIRAKNRDQLLKYLVENGIGAKIHYPIPVHLQKAASDLGYNTGDFPVCEEHCRTIISLPVHQHLTENELSHMITHLQKFYK